MNAPVITIDGPSGSGKGTIAQRLAAHLGWHYLDSGALYRVLGLAAEQQHIALTDIPALVTLAESLPVSFQAKHISDSARIMLAGQDVTEVIRTETVGTLASKVSAIPEVRKALLARQRDFRQPPGLVTDGRDMGTVVFPHATLKFFLYATPEVRAKRRYEQLQQQGVGVNLAALTREIAERDARDTQRQVAPLMAAEDAIQVDTSTLTIKEVMARVIKMVESCLPTK